VSHRVVIVGGGVCGLTLAYNVARSGLPVTILEKEGVVGGLARGFQYGDFSFDIGPHRFYSPKASIMRFISEVLGEESAEISRASSVHFLGKYHQWPLRMKSVFQLPPTVSLRALIDLINKSREYDPSNPSFENYILGKYGRTLYTLFFKGYTEKFLGIPASGTHANWAKIGVERATIDEKVNTASIGHIVKMMLIPRPREMTFLYPPGGVHKFCERLRARLQEMGVEIRTNVMPTALLSTDGEIKKVVTTEGPLDARIVVWTAPVNELCQLVGVPDPDLHYLSLVLYNTILKVPTRQKVQWCYYGSDDIVFSRISYPEQFHHSMTPRYRGSMCIELTCRRGDERWTDPEREIPRIRRDLVKVGAIGSESEIDAMHIERIDNAYPIYDLGYRDKFKTARRRLEEFRNLHLGGRTGLFWYNNMDHSMNNAFQISKKILGNTVEEGLKEGPAARRVLEEMEREGASGPLAAGGPQV